jgi:hypothetical protein
VKSKRIIDRKKAKEIEKKMLQRQRKVQYVFDACPQIETLETSPNPNKLPIGQLISACRQFMMGYYENSILNSAFAVEYSLLFKINSELNGTDKMAIAEKYKGGFDLRYALNLARGKWIDEPLYNELQLLNNLRDMSAHPSNWITLYKLLGKQFADEEIAKKWVSKAANKSPVQIAESLKDGFDVEKAKQTHAAMSSYADARWANLPDLEWATKKDTLAFQRDYVRRYLQPMVDELLNDKKIIGLIQNPSTAAEFVMNRYRFPEDTALRAIDMAFEALKQLKVI